MFASLSISITFSFNAICSSSAFSFIRDTHNSTFCSLASEPIAAWINRKAFEKVSFQWNTMISRWTKRCVSQAPFYHGPLKVQTHYFIADIEWCSCPRDLMLTHILLHYLVESFSVWCFIEKVTVKEYFFPVHFSLALCDPCKPYYIHTLSRTHNLSLSFLTANLQFVCYWLVYISPATAIHEGTMETLLLSKAAHVECNHKIFEGSCKREKRKMQTK